MSSILDSKPPETEEDVSYFFEMIKHPANGWGLVGGLLAGSVLSIATGIAPVLLLPVVAQAGINAMMGLFLPDSPVFREMINRKKRSDRRSTTREYLVEEIGKRVTGPHPHWETYYRMVEQLNALRRAASEQTNGMSRWDLERLDDTTVNYLRLWLARITMHERARETDTERVQARLRKVDSELTSTDLSPMNRSKLEKARGDLTKVLGRRRGFDMHEHSMAASMLAMADAFSEIHHRTMTNPGGGDLGDYLTDALERMHVTEELDYAADMEIDEVVAGVRAARGAAEASLASSGGGSANRQTADAKRAEAMQKAQTHKQTAAVRKGQRKKR